MSRGGAVTARTHRGRGGLLGGTGGRSCSNYPLSVTHQDCHQGSGPPVDRLSLLVSDVSEDSDTFCLGLGENSYGVRYLDAELS